MKDFEVVDHGADMAIVARGDTMERLFVHAAQGLVSILVGTGEVREEERKLVALDGDENLLVFFLNEILYLWDTQRFIPGRIEVFFDDEGLNAELHGELFDERRHEARTEVKAVTYHGFEIAREGDTFRATLVLDV